MFSLLPQWTEDPYKVPFSGAFKDTLTSKNSYVVRGTTLADKQKANKETEKYIMDLFVLSIKIKSQTLGCP